MSQRKAERTGIYYLAGDTLDVARKAHDRLDDGRPAQQPGDSDEGFTAIVFSAVALEAFISELGGLATGLGGGKGHEHHKVRQLGILLAEAEAGRESVRFKYQLAKTILSGHPYDKGTQPYQDFDLLIKLRDSIVHPKPATFVFEGGDLRQSDDTLRIRMEERGIVPKLLTHVRMVPLSWLTSRLVARWAINASVTMVRTVLDGLPRGDFRTRVRKGYIHHFRPISGPSSNEGPWIKPGITAE
jgi:hypothetical protein